MAYVGYMGDVVFTTSDSMLRTITDMNRNGSARWTDHAVMCRKPVSQFIGPDLEQITFRIILSSQHGLNPNAELKRLRRMRDTGEVFPLIIAGRPISQNLWRLDSLMEDKGFYTGIGATLQITATVTLKEYAEGTAQENLMSQIKTAVGALFG